MDLYVLYVMDIHNPLPTNQALKKMQKLSVLILKLLEIWHYCTATSCMKSSTQVLSF